MRTSLLCLLLFVFAACDEGERRLPKASGAQGEVLVVMDKADWDGEAGAAVRSVLEQYIPHMPQREPHFRVAQVPHSAFGDLLQVHRNVLLTDIGQAFDSARVQRQVDRYSIGQVVVQVTAPDLIAFRGVLEQRAELIRAAFDDAERERIGGRLALENDPTLTSAILAGHGIHLKIPGGFRVAKSDEHCTWLRRDRLVSGSGLEHDVQEGLLVYTYPYVSDSTFTLNALVNMRDSVLRRYVQGVDPGSYMITQRAFEEIDLMPSSHTLTVDNEFAVELRGQWAMHGMRMGGPYIALVVLDKANDRVVTVEGYVYAPQFDKREYLRELEGVLYTLRLSENASS